MKDVAHSVGGRRRLLFLCHTLPFPPDTGASIRTYNVLRLLAAEYDVRALCFFRSAERSSAAHVEAAIRGLRPFAKVETFPIPQERSRTRFFLDHVRSIATGRPYTEYVYESGAFRRRLTQLLETERFELVHVDSLDLASYLPSLSSLPVVCVHHNAESALLARRGGTVRGMRGAYMRLQARLLREAEQRWLPRVALNITVSDADRRILKAQAPGAAFAVVPNGVDTSLFVPGAIDTGEIVFVGGWSWYPNREAMEHFCEEILPRIRARGVSAPVVWVGRVPEKIRASFASRYGVRMTGYVEDIRPITSACSCYVAPLRSGSGTRLKILDAWAMGRAVVSTSIGCEGLDARDGENIVVRDEPAAFADAVVELLTNRELRETLGHSARYTAENVYDWRMIGRTMLPLYRSCAMSAKPSARVDALSGDGRS